MAAIIDVRKVGVGEGLTRAIVTLSPGEFGEDRRLALVVSGGAVEVVPMLLGVVVVIVLLSLGEFNR